MAGVVRRAAINVPFATRQDAAKRPKRDLIRLVRSLQGEVSVDLTGKKPGRGAYLCAAAECWAVGLKKGALERALKVTISDGDRAALAAYAAGLESDGGPAS